MKKEIIAAAILVVLLAVSLVNSHYISVQTERLTSQIEQAQAFCERGEKTLAAEALSGAIDGWKKLDSYVHIMMRHDEIDPISDEFYALLSAVESDHATRADFENLLSSLKALAAMEKVSFCSVF